MAAIKDEQRLRHCRGTSPCDGCTERFTACWDRCPKDERGEFGYKAWKAYNAWVDNNRKTYDSLNRRKRWHPYE